MNNRLAIFDLDGTIINGQSQRYFLSYLLQRKLIGLVQYINIMSWFVLYKMGLIYSPDKVMEYAFSFLKGYDCKEFDLICNDFVKSVLHKKIYLGAKETIDIHRRNGEKIIIVSNSIEPLVRSVTNFLCIDDCISTKLEIVDSHYTGKISMINYSDAKKSNVTKYSKDNNLIISYSYGDHLSDIPVLEIADNPIATNPDRKLKKVAISKGWRIVHFN